MRIRVQLKIVLFAALTTLAAPVARAHPGPRIWIGNVAGRITTFTSDNDLDPVTYTASRLFVAEFDDLGGVFTTSFPGYEVRRDGGNVSGGSTFGFNVAGPALYYDADSGGFRTVLQQFGPPQPGPVPQLALTRGLSSCVTAAGAVAGFNFFTFNQIGDHAHLGYTLLGDGSTASDGPSGVYALAMNLTGGGLAESQTYYLLLGKDVEIEDALFQEAFAAAQALLAPTPVVGDMNCDGALTAADVPDFVQALLDPDGYEASHPTCDILRGDLNADDAVDAADVQFLVDALL